MTRHVDDRVFVIQDPAYPQALHFIEALRRGWGMRPVCLWSDADLRRAEAWRYPVLRSDWVAAHYDGDPHRLGDAARFISERHLAAVVPWRESMVLPSSELAEHLGLSWAQPDVLPLFRDKHALKSRLRADPDGPRVNAIAVVSSVEDVERAVATGFFDRFVLKPNDGFGNRRIGFFERDTPPASIAEHLDSVGGSALMEEFIDGEEYYVNGQVDGAGRVTVTLVGRYERAEVNGKPNIEVGGRTVSHASEEFTLLADYAARVLQTLGLRRSPFHLEAKIDERGPCLVEVGARLVGTDAAVDDGQVHGDRFDAYTLAAHYYLTADDLGPVPVDWERYDSARLGHLQGAALVDERIYEVRGCEEVEALPEFVRWVVRPAPGDRVSRTLDLGDVPWHVVIEAQDDDAYDRAAARVRALIGWNDRSTGPVRALREVASLSTPVVRRLRMWRRRSSIRPVPVPRPDQSDQPRKD
jgi:hypothetical protein